MLSYFQIITELANLCKAKQSGTMFIKTQDNKSVRFTLENGEIVSCCYRQTKGYDALPMVVAIESGTFSFNEHPPLGTSHPALPPTSELLAMLSSKEEPAGPVQQPKQNAEPAVPSATQTVQTEVKPAVAQVKKLNTTNDVIFAEMQSILTEFVGPMSGVLFSRYESDKDQIMSDVVEFEHMIDDLATQIGNSKESEEFKTRILDMVNRYI